MKSLCFIMYQFKIGGCERVFLSLARIIPNPIYLLIVTGEYDDSFYREIPKNVTVITPYEIPCFRILLKYKNNFIFNKVIFIFMLFIEILYLRMKFFKEEIQFINFTDSLSSLMITFFSAKRNSSISWVHCKPSALKYSSCFKLYCWILLRCKKIVCICEEQKALLLKMIKKIKKSNVLVIYNPLDIKNILEKSKEIIPVKTSYIVMVARIDKRSKDFYTLIEAFNLLPIKLKQQYPLYIIGDGPDLLEFCRYIKEHKIENIHFLGQDSNPYKWIRNSSLFVFSSKSEGLPTVLLEAMACETLVLSTSCETGPREILQDGKCGLLVPVGDVKKMSEAINKVLSKNMTEYGKDFVLNANERIKDFSFQNISKCLIKSGII